MPGAGVVPAARSMIQVLTDVARRYSERTVEPRAATE
jgi:hypothetical protein